MTAGKPEEVAKQAKLSRKRCSFSAIEQITEVSGDGYTAVPKGLNPKPGGRRGEMVDSFDLFRRLSCGANYDRQKFSKELATFNVSLLTLAQCGMPMSNRQSFKI